MKNTASKLYLAGAMTFALAAPAMAVNSYYAAGDLVLTFQKVGDTNTVYVGLGNAATLYRGATAGPDAANKINFLDLNAKLTEAFGSNWATDPDIFAGLAGIYSKSDTSSLVVNGDAPRTVYVSASRDDVGTVGSANSAQWAISGDTDLTNAASDIQTQNNFFGDIGTSFPNGYNSQIIVSPTSASKIDDLQPLTIFQGVASQGLAFRVFEGGIQQQGSASSFGTFGAAGSAEFALDLYRLVAVEGLTNEVAGTGTTGEGTYEGTITVGTNGMVSFVAQGSGPVVVAPLITTQPASVTINTGATTTFTVVASGTLPTFQWYTGTSGDTANPVSGATSDTYTTPALSATTSYWVRAHNSAGDADSNTATATVRSPYDSWMNGYPLITLGADQLPAADPDKDGISNLMESVLSGDPSVSSTSILPILSVTTTDFIFSFNRRDGSESSTTLTFQYSGDLINWTSATIGTSGTTVGDATISVTENSTSPDAITVTVPKTVAPGGKLYGRLKVTQP